MDNVVLISIPGLRQRDLAHMPMLRALTGGGDAAPLAASCPAVTCPVQTNMMTGLPPSEHGVVANGFYWRDRGELEMWTAWSEVVQKPRIWDRLRAHDPALTSAAWFPLLVKGCGADYVATPAPIHNPDGSESLWCYTKPESLYGELRDALGHFPLHKFWGPLAGVESSAWIVSSALEAAKRWRPNFFYVYLPHLDYAAQKHGPDTPQAAAACRELDAEVDRLAEGVAASYGAQRPLWLVASEYAIVPVQRVVHPNRALRAAGLLSVRVDEDGREDLDLRGSKAWALVDHQVAHVFVQDRDAATIARAMDALRPLEGVAQALAGDDRRLVDLDHERSGDIVLVAEPDAWLAYYFWTEDRRAPAYARTVDIHRKPGYDPLELWMDPATRCVPLDATAVRGSHGAPVATEAQRGVVLSSERGVFVERAMADVDVAELVLRQFGL